jgi:hypothetical protein
MTAPVTGEVFVSHRMLFVVRASTHELLAPEMTTGSMIDEVPGGFVIWTGIATGPVAISVILSVPADEGLLPDKEEDYAECPFEVADEGVRVAALFTDVPEQLRQIPIPSGSYTLRVVASGRARDPDGTADEPWESYRVRFESVSRSRR